MKRKIASLPMYMVPETVEDNNAFWELIRRNLEAEGLDPPHSLGTQEFNNPSHPLDELYFSQICGLPYRLHLAEHVTLIGTPDYGVFGCRPGYSRSAFVSRHDDKRRRFREFDGAILAYNSEVSQSGHAVAMTLARDEKIEFGGMVQSGSHHRSIQLVAAGQADIAAIDAVSLELFSRVQSCPNLDQLRVVAWSRPSPGLPYVTHKRADPEPYRRAVKSAIAALSIEQQYRLRLFDLVEISPAAYLNS